MTATHTKQNTRILSHRSYKALPVILLTLPLLLPAGVPGSLATPQQKSAAQPQKPAAQPQKSATLKPATDGGWPRTYKLASGSATVYQPQVSSWEDQKHIVV